ncbi:MAG TPA: DUF2269 family protein [Solirubrobacterales bacterium]|nr:DUF2269 family protein [Solirubrobacterales bacterium]
MPVAAVEFYDVIRWLHITAVVVAFGPTFAFGVYLAIAQRSDTRSVPVMIEATIAVNRSLVTFGAILVFATGIYLTIDRFSFGDVFVNVGMIGVIVLIGVVHAFFIPNDRKAAELARRDIGSAGAGEIKLSAEFARRSARSAQVGIAAGLAIVVIIYFMTAKPFL